MTASVVVSNGSRTEGSHSIGQHCIDQDVSDRRCIAVRVGSLRCGLCTVVSYGRGQSCLRCTVAFDVRCLRWVAACVDLKVVVLLYDTDSGQLFDLVDGQLFEMDIGVLFEMSFDSCLRWEQ